MLSIQSSRIAKNSNLCSLSFVKGEQAELAALFERTDTMRRPLLRWILTRSATRWALGLTKENRIRSKRWDVALRGGFQGDEMRRDIDRTTQQERSSQPGCLHQALKSSEASFGKLSCSSGVVPARCYNNIR